MSQTKAANLIGIARSTYAKWEDRMTAPLPEYVRIKFETALESEKAGV